MLTPLPTAAGPQRAQGVVPQEAVTTARAAATPGVTPFGPAQPGFAQPGPAHGQPPLPDPDGPQAPERAVQGVVRGLMGADDDISGFTLYALLQRAAQRGLETQRTLQRGAQSTLNLAKSQEAAHTLDQVLGQNKSARVNALGMGSGAALTLVGVALGVSHEQPFLGQIASQATQVLQPMISVVDRSSARLGGSYHANLASLAIKDDAIHTQGGSAALETARGAVEAGQERLKSALDFLTNHLPRRADVLDRMAH